MSEVRLVGEVNRLGALVSDLRAENARLVGVISDETIRREMAEASFKTSVQQFERVRVYAVSATEVLSDLLRQVDKFVEENGEADFYTGSARAVLAKNPAKETPAMREAIQAIRSIRRETNPLRIRIWHRGAPDSIVIRFQRDVTNEEMESLPRALMAALELRHQSCTQSPTPRTDEAVARDMRDPANWANLARELERDAADWRARFDGKVAYMRETEATRHQVCNHAPPEEQIAELRRDRDDAYEGASMLNAEANKWMLQATHAIKLLREARAVILGPLDRDVVTQIDTFLAGDYPGAVANDGKMHLDWCLALNDKPCNCCHVAGKKSPALLTAGGTCEKCGNPAWPGVEGPVMVLGERVWHRRCFPDGGVQA